jgi:hypothetical protein
MSDQEITDAEIVAEIFERISNGDEEAAFDLAQFCMPRVVKRDVDAMMDMIEGLSRASERLGSTHAKAFLNEDWKALRAILAKRIRRELGEI